MKINWIKKNWISISLVVIMIGMITYHFFGTYNPPITQPVIVSPKTIDKTLNNGQIAQQKVNTPPTENPVNAGFSEEYLRDTIQNILGVKQQEILAINKVSGKYHDSLQLFKTELNEQKKLTKYYQSKDREGNVIGSAQTTDDGPLVYKGNISLTNVVKKGKVDKRGNKLSPDSLIFYDPTERVTINESKEFLYTVPFKPVKKKFRVTPTIGVGVLAPVNVKDSKVNMQEVKFGFFGGIGASYSF